MRDVKPRASGRKLTWRGFCAPFAGAPELNDDKQAGIRYDVRATAVKLANAAYMLKTCPADALAHLLPHLLRLLGGAQHARARRCGACEGALPVQSESRACLERASSPSAILQSQRAAITKKDGYLYCCASVKVIKLNLSGTGTRSPERALVGTRTRRNLRSSERARV